MSLPPDSLPTPSPKGLEHQPLTPRKHPLGAASVDTLKAALPDLRFIYRYGSAGGPYQRPDSDLDLAVRADHKLTLDERLDLAQKLARLSGCEVDLNDLRQLPVTLRVQIVLEGVLLYAAERRRSAGLRHAYPVRLRAAQ